MLADQLDFVVGVDTHRDTHAVAVLAVASGAVVFEASVAADGGGYAEALRLASRHAPGRRAFAIEGTSSYGAGLSRFLLEAPTNAHLTNIEASLAQMTASSPERPWFGSISACTGLGTDRSCGAYGSICSPSIARVAASQRLMKPSSAS